MSGCDRFIDKPLAALIDAYAQAIGRCKPELGITEAFNLAREAFAREGDFNSGPGGATVRGALPNRGDEVRAGRRCLGEGRSHQLPAGRLLSCDSRLEPRAIHDSADEQMPRAHSNLAICRSAKSPEVPRSTF